MKVRSANRWDFPEIIEMLRHYRTSTPWERLAKCDNEEYIMKILTYMISGMGIMLVSEQDDELTGMLLAVKNPNAWDPDLYVMNELCYWVEPEHRGSRAGYKLIKEYKLRCETMKAENKIEAYTLSKMVTSPDLDYQRLGFEKQEEMWRA
jgi:GNAT superfamily N-acetyltransferase